MLMWYTTPIANSHETEIKGDTFFSNLTCCNFTNSIPLVKTA